MKTKGKVEEIEVEEVPILEPGQFDFRKIEVADLDETKYFLDMSKLLGNYLYTTAGDLGILEVAQQIYKTGIIEITPELRVYLLDALKSKTAPFILIAKMRLIEMLEG